MIQALPWYMAFVRGNSLPWRQGKTWCPPQAPVVVIKKDRKDKHRDETPEERAARKQAKKMKKEAKRAREGGERPSVSEPLSP